MQYLLPVLAMANFTSSLSARSLDPVLPQVASDLLVTIPTAALVASAFAFTFAMVQPGLGVIGDLIGKPRVISACLLLVGIGNIVGAFASSFDVLLLSRIVCGVGAGGVVPVAISLISDVFPVSQRQVAHSRLLAGGMSGLLLGATLSGVIGDLVGWRAVLLTIGSMVIVASAAVRWSFRHQERAARKQFSTRSLFEDYRFIIAHPHAFICFIALFTNGMCIHGLFPYISAFLRETGQTSLSIAGLVIAGFAIGGLTYSLSISFLLRHLREKGLMIVGGSPEGARPGLGFHLRDHVLLECPPPARSEGCLRAEDG